MHVMFSISRLLCIYAYVIHITTYVIRIENKSLNKKFELHEKHAILNALLIIIVNNPMND